MLCECSEPGCQSIVLIGLGRYDELRETGFFTVPDHPVEEAEPALRADDYWLQRPLEPGGERGHVRH